MLLILKGDGKIKRITIIMIKVKYYWSLRVIYDSIIIICIRTHTLYFGFYCYYYYLVVVK